MFDVLRFLEANNIEHTDKGSGVKKGNVVIHCPFCGDAAKGDYLGIRLSDGAWGCWKDSKHRGKRPTFLVAKLLGISFEQALEITGERELSPVNKNEFNELADGDFFLDVKKEIINDTRKIKSLLMPDESFPLWVNRYSANRFLDYLYYVRGISEPEKISKYYYLHYAISGKYKDRIIIPVYYKNNLVTWTARSIYADHALRYLTLSAEEEALNIKSTLYNYDRANRKGETLFLVEGPIDSIKFDWHIKREKSRVIALSSLTLEEMQLYILYELSFKYKNVVVLLDQGELSSSILLTDMLTSFLDCNVMQGELPRKVKDPGELTENQCFDLLNKYRSK